MDEGRYIKLSVVIACFNAEKWIGDQLEALATQQWSEPWEIIVVNNRSTDGSMAVVDRYRKRMPHLRAIEASEKQGAAYAMNVGVRATRGAWLAFCDADDVVGAGWVAGMAEALAMHAFVSGPHDVTRLNHSALQRGRINSQPTGVQPYTDPPFLPHAGAGNMGIHRAVFDSVGGFDETMPALFDTDFCWRVQLSGVPLVAAPKAILHVRYRAEACALYRQAKSYGQYNVFIYRRYRAKGMPRLDWKSGLAAWIGLARSASRLFAKEQRAPWLWELGWRLGRLKGCLKYRVLAP